MLPIPGCETAHLRGPRNRLILPALLSISFITLALAPCILRVAAAPPAVPPAVPHVLLGTSPFLNRIQAEADAVRLTCRLLLPQRASVAAVIHSEISGSLAHALRHFCRANSFKPSDSPHINVQTLAFGSGLALRTSLMLNRIDQLPPPARVRAQPPTAVHAGSCCQPSSDIDELSFPPLCCETSHEEASVSFILKRGKHCTYNHSTGGPVSRFLSCGTSTGFVRTFNRHRPTHDA